MGDNHEMPAPEGLYAQVPVGWPPQTWGAHLARIEFMTAMGQGHHSFTDPERHVRMFKDRLSKEIWTAFIELVSQDGLGTGKTQKNLLGSIEYHKKLFDQAAESV